MTRTSSKREGKTCRGTAHAAPQLPLIDIALTRQAKIKGQMIHQSDHKMIARLSLSVAKPVQPDLIRSPQTSQSSRSSQSSCGGRKAPRSGLKLLHERVVQRILGGAFRSKHLCPDREQ